MKKVIINQLDADNYSVTEAMNSLVTNLSFSGDDIRCIQVTSRYASEGKSTIACRLAKTIAGLGRSVVLLDTDLRRSEIVRKYKMDFGTTDYMGLAHYLSGQCEMDEILYETNIEGLYYVPIGREVFSSLKLLSSPKLKSLINRLRDGADMVIVDTSPAGVIVDALEVAKHCDGAMVVVGYNQGHMRELTELKKNLERAGCPVLGTVLNAVPKEEYSSRKYYYKYKNYGGYYYRHGTQGKSEHHSKEK